MRYLGGAHSKVDWGKLPARMLVFIFTALVVTSRVGIWVPLPLYCLLLLA